MVNGSFSMFGGWMKQQQGAVMVDVHDVKLAWVRVDVDVDDQTASFTDSNGTLLFSASNIGAVVYPAVSIRGVTGQVTIISRQK